MAAPVSIGLDIGSTAIRAVEVSRSNKRLLIDAFGEAVLPEGATKHGVVQDPRAVTAAVRDLWSGKRFRSKSVRLGVTHQQVVVREVEVTDLPPKDMRRALPHQVRDVLPFPVEQAVLDFHPLAGQGERKDTVLGLLVAAPKEAIIDTVHAVEKAGLHVEKVDLACFAMLRALAAATDGPEAIVDIGSHRTLVVVHTGGIPRIVRTIPRGGNDITALLASRLSLPYKEAEELKVRIGTAAVLDEHAETEHVVSEIVNEGVRPLINEIRSSISYFLKAHPDEAIGRLCLAGGAAQLPGLTGVLTRTLDLPVFQGDPFQYVATARHRGEGESLRRFRSSSAVSVGLALGAR